jgi:hypothetical protein
MNSHYGWLMSLQNQRQKTNSKEPINSFKIQKFPQKQPTTKIIQKAVMTEGI